MRAKNRRIAVTGSSLTMLLLVLLSFMALASAHQTGKDDDKACATITPPEAVCKRDGSGYSYTFSVRNDSGKNVVHILLTPGSSGFTLNKQIVKTPLLPGESTTITVDIGNVQSGSKPCFYVTLMTKEGPCCTVEVCPVLPNCCATATGKFACDPKGEYTGTFSIVNTSSKVVRNIYFYEPPGTKFSQTYFAVTLAPGQTFTTPLITITGAKPGRFCFHVSLHTEDMKECCDVEVCIELPQCGDKTGSLNPKPPPPIRGTSDPGGPGTGLTATLAVTLLLTSWRTSFTG